MDGAKCGTAENCLSYVALGSKHANGFDFGAPPLPPFGMEERWPKAGREGAVKVVVKSEFILSRS
jgi:hypothetical protein